MTREEKTQAIEELQAMLKDTNVVYLADASSMNSADTTKLRGECYKAEIKMQVVKNTLLRIAMERTEGREYGELYDVLKGQTALMTSTVGNAPAKLIKDFRKGGERPILKGAYVEEAVLAVREGGQLCSEDLEGRAVVALGRVDVFHQL